MKKFLIGLENRTIVIFKMADKDKNLTVHQIQEKVSFGDPRIKIIDTGFDDEISIEIVRIDGKNPITSLTIGENVSRLRIYSKEPIYCDINIRTNVVRDVRIKNIMPTCPLFEKETDLDIFLFECFEFFSPVYLNVVVKKKLSISLRRIFLEKLIKFEKDLQYLSPLKGDSDIDLADYFTSIKTIAEEFEEKSSRDYIFSNTNKNPISHYYYSFPREKVKFGGLRKTCVLDSKITNFHFKALNEEDGLIFDHITRNRNNITLHIYTENFDLYGIREISDDNELSKVKIFFHGNTKKVYKLNYLPVKQQMKEISSPDGNFTFFGFLPKKIQCFCKNRGSKICFVSPANDQIDLILDSNITYLGEKFGVVDGCTLVGKTYYVS